MAFGKIVILNGTSSSGKTSIVSVLQEILQEPYLDAGIDKFLWMLPTRFLNRPLWDEVLGLATEAATSAEECARRIKRRIEEHAPPSAFKRLRSQIPS